jgi:3-mercaptopyruvate sulfurtransferase SseA
MRKGYKKVRPLDGGIEAWIAAGHEVALMEIASDG